MDVAIVDVSWLPTDDIVRNEESLALAVNWLVVDWQWKMRWPFFFWQQFYLCMPQRSTVGTTYNVQRSRRIQKKLGINLLYIQNEVACFTSTMKADEN